MPHFSSRFSGGTADAARRLRAVLAVMDDDLAQLERLLATPLAPTVLADTEWHTAETDRRAVEQSLHALERQAAVVTAQRRDWRTKAALAAQQGNASLAEQARMQSADAETAEQLYIREINAVHVFLDEWAVRVTRATPRTPLSAAG